MDAITRLFRRQRPHRPPPDPEPPVPATQPNMMTAVGGGVLVSCVMVGVLGAVVLIDELDDKVVRVLIPALITALVSVLVAAGLATAIQRQFARLGGTPRRRVDYGAEFQRYVGRFSWLVAPITVSYGTARVVEIFVNASRSAPPASLVP